MKKSLTIESQKCFALQTRHEHFINEIESNDTTSLGLVIRAIYEGDEEAKFLEQLESRIRQHDRDIERMCNYHYQGFIDSIRELLQVRSQAQKLNTELIDLNSELEDASRRVIEKTEELVRARKIEANIAATIQSLQACLPVLTTYSKLEKQMKEKRYYPALKTLEQLETQFLPRVASYRFSGQMKENIPKLRESIKEASMSDLKDFLENIRKVSPRIGEVAMKHTSEQLTVDPGVLRRKKKKAPPPPNPFTGEIDRGDGGSEELPELDAEELSAQDLIDFSPVYRCLHIFSLLDSREDFQGYYRKQRKQQATLVLQPPTNMHESIEGYRLYLQSVLGFLVAEDHVFNTADGLIDRAYLEELWASAASRIVASLRTHSAYCTDATLMLKIKNLIMLFITTLRNYGYSVNQIFEVLHEIRDHYNEVLMQRWVSVFREILDEESFQPTQVETPEEYEAVTSAFPFQDDELEGRPFPKCFPFSPLVPSVYHQVKEFIYACIKFSEDLGLSQGEVDEMIRKSTNLLLTRTFTGCLSSVFRKPSLGLTQLIQIIIDTRYLEEATVYLEEFVSNIAGCGREMSLRAPTRGVGSCSIQRGPPEPEDGLFGAARTDAERQICEKLKRKLDEFLELEAYDWLLVEPQGHASPFILDLIAFLRSTFSSSLTGLPEEVARAACKSACEHIAKSLMGMVLNDEVKQISMGALQQLNLDTIQCEQFAAGEPVRGLEEGCLLGHFSDLRQILDLFMSWDWPTYFHDYGQEASKYQRVSPSTAIILLEKIREADKKTVFSVLKKSERDKKKLLETVLKQLKQLALTASQQQQQT